METNKHCSKALASPLRRQSFLKLPTEIRLEIYSHCTAFTLVQLYHTCATLHNEIERYPSIYQTSFGYGPSQWSPPNNDGLVYLGLSRINKVSSIKECYQYWTSFEDFAGEQYRNAKVELPEDKHVSSNS
ncbi:hypothetical protein BJ508DRAFT_362602 [Ascobolus immersus RN42]|uniref:F-box domain-containing protein n=1 Tax=Ascobolus immersus RN42 TaxID=1160509 RepID=A0A3N4I2U0_ASCIM|nr:hypothetical protein BJ508DRAFT_362602 [Ascobolus immersus RN42]